MTSKNIKHTWIVALILAAALAGAPGKAGALVTLFGPSGMDWDIYDTSYGYIYDGETDAYDACYYLRVNGTVYYASGTAGTSTCSGRGVRMYTQTNGTLRVTRNVYVPDTGSHDFLRYYDTFENTSTSPATVTAEYYGGLGSDSTTIITATSSGDTLLDTTDTWYCTHDSSSVTTPCGHVWTDRLILDPTTMSLSGDAVSTIFSFTVPAGETKALMIFAVQDTTRTAVQSTVEWLEDLPDQALTCLTGEEEYAVVNWHVSGAPLISLVTETLEVVEGGEIALEVNVVDMEGDPFTVYWELDGDDFFDDGTGTTATFSALGFDGPSTHEIKVRAQDSAEERIFTFNVDILNALPVFLSDPAEDPGLNAYRGREWVYYLEVEDPANADGIVRDPVIITVPTKPEGMIYFGDQHFEWTPKMDGSDVGNHTLRIEADDRDGEEGEIAVQEVVIEVLENAPPDTPTIISPNMVAVPTVRPTLVVGNATDIDGDSLSYTFEVATTEDFSTVVARGQVFGGAGGQTEWVVTTTLFDATRYHWRVWANDGRADGDSVQTWFDVDTTLAPEESSDASSDVETDGIPPIPTPSDSGCGCRLVATAAGDLPWAVIGIALLALALVTRRRR